MTDHRARMSVTATGSSLLDVEPKLVAKADKVFGPGRWHQHGPIDLTEDDIHPGGYKARMDVVATDGPTDVNGL